jgi:hypothetical protein
MISSRASCSAFDSATSGESSASRSEAARVTRLVGAMVFNWLCVDPGQFRERCWGKADATIEVDELEGSWGGNGQPFHSLRAINHNGGAVPLLSAGTRLARGIEERGVGDRGLCQPVSPRLAPGLKELGRGSAGWTCHTLYKSPVSTFGVLPRLCLCLVQHSYFDNICGQLHHDFSESRVSEAYFEPRIAYEPYNLE